MTNSKNNAYEFSVSELAFSLKRMVEDAYGRVRVRGELGRVTIAKSGHMYADLKDDKAVIASIMWKGNLSRLAIRPEEGMEVVATGKLSTYPGRSQYQLIMDSLEPAGIGALMALLEKRKKMFMAEGLFDEKHKQELPYLPRVIGVVTSPTGAVIRDILHRISDRFPVHVIVWPVLVQGEKAAEQISQAIKGFNKLEIGGEIPRPDLLIVARGGGSVEDLWCFNEENVVRAAFASKIPLISAVGHETDTTLIDYVSDARAPTPTGAAEISVPVRIDLIATIDDYETRLKHGLVRIMQKKQADFKGAQLPKLEAVLSAPNQRFDRISARLLPALEQNKHKHSSDFRAIAARLRPEALRLDISRKSQSLETGMRAAKRQIRHLLQRKSDRLKQASQLLQAFSYQNVLERGFVLITDEQGKLLRSAKQLSEGDKVNIGFADGKKPAIIKADKYKPTKQANLFDE